MNTLSMRYKIGAPVMTGDVNIYHIYYGKWTKAQMELLDDFTRGLGESEWWTTMRKYYYQETKSSPKVYVTGSMKLVTSITDKYSKGKNLKDDDIPSIIRSKVKSRELPEDENGIYMFLSSSDVQEQMLDGNKRFCEHYCGYHNQVKFESGALMYYAMAGQPDDRCLSGCIPNSVFSPYGELATEAIPSTIAHELAETVSDPRVNDIRAWNSPSGFENGDLCADEYGKTIRLTSGAMYNYESPGTKTKFLVQENFDPELQKCVQRA